ncbi:MAG: DUF4325 domain-containing protein [Deltaproteobacteria bacterium]|nr:DUF4325 domain-containing protein [Deltaproteobacteria bacterium]
MKQKILDFFKKRKMLGISDLSSHFQVSPQAIHKHLRELIQAGVVLKQGASRKTTYYVEASSAASLKSGPAPLLKTYTNKNLKEDEVYRELSSKYVSLKTLPHSLEQVFIFAFTEMLNNAIDHSKSKKIKIKIDQDKQNICFLIQDQGVGIFHNIQKNKKLNNPLEAIQDLLKGKQTTMPDKHSGEGIFFTSKLADVFWIKSHKKTLILNNLIEDVFIKDNPFCKGTEVYFQISKKSSKDLKSIFLKYSNSKFEFDKSHIRISLFANEFYVSRSQAKRVLIGLEKFKVIEFDFKNVESVGQGFADEIFRVFQLQHPHITLIYINAHENVKFMIERAKRR